MFGYSYSPKSGVKFARAQSYGVDASYKDLSQVCSNIRGKRTVAAEDLLEAVDVGGAAILYRRHNKKLGHRRELGGKKGRFPRKAAAKVLEVLQNAVANAEFKGMAHPLFIAHVCANKQNTLARLSPKGRRSRADYETARIEVVLEEAPLKEGESRQPVKKDAQKVKKDQKVEAKQPQKVLA